MKRGTPVTYDTVRKIALKLPDVEEGMSYRAPALKVKGKLFVRFREDLEAIVLKTTFERREALMAKDPQSYFITDHYLAYEWVLVRLDSVPRAALPELLEIAYREALPVPRPRRARRK
jgi:hypothetical protein